MSMADLINTAVVVIGGIASIYIGYRGNKLASEQNDILRQQNMIFAAQAGILMPEHPASIPTKKRNQWPLAASLAVSLAVGIFLTIRLVPTHSWWGLAVAFPWTLVLLLASSVTYLWGKSKRRSEDFSPMPQLQKLMIRSAEGAAIEGSYAIESDAFPGCYLRMDAHQVQGPCPEGAGLVNCQKGHGPWERFRFVAYENGLNAIESIEFPNRWLRMDGSLVPVGGKGIVNCQFGNAGQWEIFRVVSQPEGLIAIRSVVFPDVFLGMDATGLTDPQPNGGGSVYCRRSVGPFEKFRLKPF